MNPDQRTPEEKLAELERLGSDLQERGRQQDQRHLEELLDKHLAPVADAIVESATSPGATGTRASARTSPVADGRARPDLSATKNRCHTEQATSGCV
jgi:hypothetical protein